MPFLNQVFTMYIILAQYRVLFLWKKLDIWDNSLYLYWKINKLIPLLKEKYTILLFHSHLCTEQLIIISALSKLRESAEISAVR